MRSCPCRSGRSPAGPRRVGRAGWPCAGSASAPRNRPRQRRRAAARSGRAPRIPHSIPRNFLRCGDHAAPCGSSRDGAARVPAWHPAACRGPITRCRMLLLHRRAGRKAADEFPAVGPEAGLACNAASPVRAPPTLAAGQGQSPSVERGGCARRASISVGNVSAGLRLVRARRFRTIATHGAGCLRA